MSDSHPDGRHLPQVGYDQVELQARGAYPSPYDYDSYGYDDTGGGASRSGKEQFQQVLDMLLRRKWMVLTVLILVIAGTAAYSYTRIEQYQTSSYVILNMMTRTLSQSSNPTPTGDTIFALNNRSLSGEIQLLKISDQLRRRVYARLEAAQDEGKNASLLRAVDSVRALQGGQLLSAALKSSWVNFEALSGSYNIIVIRGNSSVPEHARVIANLYSEEYVQLTKEASRSFATALRESLVEQERERQADLVNVESKIQTFLNEEGVVGLDPGGARIVSAIDDIEAQREQIIIDLQMQQTSLDLIDQEMAILNPALAAAVASSLPERIEIIQAELAEEDAELARILRKNPQFEGRDIDVLRPMRTKISQMQREVDSLSIEYVRQAVAAGNVSGKTDFISQLANLNQQAVDKRISIGGLQAKIRVIDARLSNYEADLNALPSQALQLAQLERARAQAERMYEYVVDRLQAAEIQEQSEPGYASILRTAYTPGSPYYPVHSEDLILGAFFGLFLALGLVFILDKFDARIYQPGQLKSQGYREIGVIPDMSRLIASDHDGEEFFEHDGLRFSTSLISVLSPISTIAEAYRQVRTYLQFNLPGDETKTILISSPGSGEGKSTTAANIAICMAQSGKRTLLIDADLRRPKLQYLFGLKRESGLRELLMNGNSVDISSWSTFIDNLSILSSSKTDGLALNAPQAAVVDRRGQHMMVKHLPELLGSDKMIAFLKSMKDSFDVIIIDSPPVLAATDAAILSTRCVATVIVARAGKTKGGDLEHSMEALADVGTKPLGVILNVFDVEKSVGHRYRYKLYSDYAGYSVYDSEVAHS